MTPMDPAPAAATAPSGTVGIALVGLAQPTPQAVLAALDAPVMPGAQTRTWNVVDSSSAISGPTAPVAIVVCDGTSGARTARTHWPEATVVALVPAHDDGTATIAALHAGAHLCIRGNDVTLIAAYLRSIARRRGLQPHENVR